MKKPYQQFKHDVLKVFYTKETGKKSRTDLRVVKWEHGKKPVLEYRKMFVNKETQEWSMTKQAGIDAEAVKAIVANADEILALLEQEQEKEKE